MIYVLITENAIYETSRTESVKSPVCCFVQYVAEVTFDMVSPGPSVRQKGQRRRKKYGRSGQPADLREGMTNAFIVLKEVRLFTCITARSNGHF